eukprot:CAMPEP_0178440306 /NCGR_PEP_ID=MMETSP0689_2-20121128/36693_1 /TAXON_ID=160604 /ORGANISM="Amphidinium massartii, Strain CS-259" /LENGTH=698 /DNA_ID=CAMNT_0020063041 /DNA_START=76 /DNA_END=2169 /DNA_ORIENTATION=+
MLFGRIFVAFSSLGVVSTSQVNPIQKVVSLLSDLTSKIEAEGAAEEKAYEEFVKWCDEASANAGFAIKTATAEKAELEAAVAKSQSDAEVSQASISELAAQISSVESDLGSATSIRAKEHEDFVSSEAELVEAVDVLSRAISILEKEMRKNPAFLQQAPSKTQSLQGLLQTLTAVIDSAALMSAQDKKKLVALVQDHQQEADSDDELGAPAAAVYKSHSTSLIDTLEDLREKAEGELADLRKGESSAAHSFDMLKQSLTDQSAALSKELSDTKAALAGSQEALAQAKGDLEMAVKDLAVSKSTKATVDGDCKTAAEDHKASMESRAEELAALKEAKDVLTSKTGGAEGRVYSFVQTSASVAGQSRMQTRSDLAQVEVVAVIKALAKKQQSTELAQLADRITAVTRYEASAGEDPFAKVKGLISDMIARLEKEASVEASHKAYCDEEQAKTAAQKAELTSDIDALSAKIDKAEATSATLKTEVAELQKQLADLLKMQADMDKARADEHTAFVAAKKDLELGLEGVQEAIRVLRDYYSSSEEESLLQQPEMPADHTMASGSGKSIIGMLEVISSDFSKNLAQETVTEDEAQTQYERMTQENKITKTTKEQDVKYKAQEAAGLDKAVAEHSADREGLQNELSAVLEYSEKLVAQCVAKPETYETRKQRRTAEIEGLKDALKYLEGEAMFLQRRPLDGHKSL